VIGRIPEGPAEITWSDLAFHTETGVSKIPAASIPAGTRVAITGDDQTGKASLAKTIAGHLNPDVGIIQVAGFDAFEATVAEPGTIVGYCGDPEVFHGTIEENVSLGRPEIHPNRVRQVLEASGLIETVLTLPDGLHTKLQTGGYPLTKEQRQRLMIARAIATHPRVLVVNGLLDALGRSERDHLWSSLTGVDATWTLVVVTNRDDIAGACENQISVRSS
jgi:ABC-type bacteriocin/lantibiotic exporter with double-glycine peptidase domain